MSAGWSLVLCALLACSGADPVGSKLQEPWGAMNLPVADGVVDEVTATELVINYVGKPSTEKAKVAGAYATQLERAGFEMGEARGMNGFMMIDGAKDGRTVSLVVSGKGKRVDVQLEIE